MNASLTYVVLDVLEHVNDTQFCIGVCIHLPKELLLQYSNTHIALRICLPSVGKY